jgi:hypothetical protein
MSEQPAPVGREPRMPVPDEPVIDFVILADRAEAVNGKLYMIGGGWDQVGVLDFAQPVNVSIALGILIPWKDANRQQLVTLTIEDQDGHPVKGPSTIQFTVGRPPYAVEGQSFRAMIVVNDQIHLPGAGTYRVLVTLANGQQKSVALHARAVQPLVPMPPGPARP